MDAADLARVVAAERVIEAVPAPSAEHLSRCLSEAWFSNTLAWYLDPRAGHGCGTAPAERFLRVVAAARVERQGQVRSGLRVGRGGKGRGATMFRLGNCSVIREFFLSGSKDRGSRYCDLVLLDLDADDSLVVVIENKLFTHDRGGQLDDYFAASETKFRRATTREYVYLTLAGSAPRGDGSATTGRPGRWAQIGWTTQLLDAWAVPLADQFPRDGGLGELVGTLRWLRQLTEGQHAETLAALRGVVLRCAAVCLFDELERLRGERAGSWERRRTSDQRVTLGHTRHPARDLVLQLLPNGSVTIQTRASGAGTTEKLLVPFGAHSDQFVNLLQIAAREVCAPKPASVHAYFDDPQSYVDDRRRRRSQRSEAELRAAPLFKLAQRHRYALQVAMSLGDSGAEGDGA